MAGALLATILPALKLLCWSDFLSFRLVHLNEKRAKRPSPLKKMSSPRSTRLSIIAHVGGSSLAIEQAQFRFGDDDAAQHARRLFRVLDLQHAAFGG